MAHEHQDDTEDLGKNADQGKSEEEKLREQEAARQEEILNLWKASEDNVSSQQLAMFNQEDLESEDQISFDFDTANPEESYRIYYTIRRILMQYLPKGPENKRWRDMVYEQKNIFLTRGHAKGENGIRGADSRMGIISTELAPALEIVTDWVNAKSTSFDLYIAFSTANKDRGYL